MSIKTYHSPTGELYGRMNEHGFVILKPFFTSLDACEKSIIFRTQHEPKLHPVRIIAPDPADKARIEKLEKALQSVQEAFFEHDIGSDPFNWLTDRIDEIIETALQDAQPNSETEPNS